MIIYRGPSKLDGKPIVMIATGLADKSKNAKTGGEVQTWILADTGNGPSADSKSGADVSVCGHCVHRASVRAEYQLAADPTFKVQPPCYVLLFQAPRSVYDAYMRGSYQDISGDRAAIRRAFRGFVVRAGSYGDPCAAPSEVWQDVYFYAAGGTGYSHQWRKYGLRGFAKFAMASVDTPEERIEANAKGWRTFRVKAKTDPVLEGEVVCPASKEAGHKTTCFLCQACSGTRGRGHSDIVINAH